MSNYSKDVFFEPWVGTEYKNGIKLENEETYKIKNKELQLCNDSEGLPKVMVLGLEHYCYEDNNHCDVSSDKQIFYINCLKRINKYLITQVQQAKNITNIHTDIQKKLDELKNLYSTKDISNSMNYFGIKTKYMDKLYILHKHLQKYDENGYKQFKDKYKSIAFLAKTSKELYKDMGKDGKSNDLLLLAIENFMAVHCLLQNLTSITPQQLEQLFWMALKEEFVSLNDLKTPNTKSREELAKNIEDDMNLKERLNEANNKKCCHMHKSCNILGCNLNDNKKCGKCYHLPICKKMTKRELTDYILLGEEPNAKNSFYKFRNAFFDQSTINDLKKFAFFNFFQRGMPETDSGKNEEFRTNAEIETLEKTRAVKAFANVVNKLHPDIIFVWGVESSPIWQGIISNQQDLKASGISIRGIQSNTTIPHIHINKYPIRKEKAKKKFYIPFTVLDLNNEFSSLLVLMDHPSSWHYVKKGNEPFKLFIKCVLKYWRVFIRWDDTTKPFTCIFDENLQWIKFNNVNNSFK